MSLDKYSIMQEIVDLNKQRLDGVSKIAGFEIDFVIDKYEETLRGLLAKPIATITTTGDTEVRYYETVF